MMIPDQYGRKPFDKSLVNLHTHEVGQVFQTPQLLAACRRLTLHPGSGMNRFLDFYHPLSFMRHIDAIAIFAHYQENVIGWALFTRENDEFDFKNIDGKESCAQIYVDYEYRMHGVGKQLLGLAAQMAQPNVLRVYSWSNRGFFDNVTKNLPHVQCVQPFYSP